MRWWLRAIASAIPVTAAILVLGMWFRSHGTFDRLSVPLGAQRAIIFISYRGSVTITLANVSIPHIWRESGPSHPIGTRTPDMIWPTERVVGFGWAYNRLMHNIPNSPLPPGDRLGLTGRSWSSTGSGAMLPDWFVLMTLLALAPLPWRSPRYSLRVFLGAMTLAVILLAIFTMASRAPNVHWENGVLVTE